MSNIPKDLHNKLTSTAAEIDPRFKQQLKNSLFKEETMSVSISQRIKRFLKYVRTAPALAVFAALVIVGTSSALVATTRTNNARNAEIEVPADLTGVMKFEDIRTIATKDVPGGTIKGIELENEHGTLLYKVKFADGSVRFYNAKTGEAVSKAEVQSNDPVPANLQSDIGTEQARSIAQAKRPGQTITKIELETEEGVTVFSVRFSDGGRVDVKASNGDVVRVVNASNSGSTSSSNSGSGSSQSSGSNDNSGSGSSGSGSDDSGSSHSGSSNSGSGSDDSGKHN
jgi:uncharacterized membrane protein YkoI